jgi:cysteine desulfurase / selenocysteine lyase
MSDLKHFKQSFSRGEGFVHLNNAGLAPVSSAARQSVDFWNQRFYHEGMHCNDDYMEAAEHARGQLATLVGCQAGEIAFFQSTAGAISQVAFGMQLSSDDEVLLWDQEYPSNLYPWKVACDRSGARLKLLPSEEGYGAPLEKLLEAVTERTRVIALSWVQYQTGEVSDLQILSDFARARGIWTVVDVIQGLGARPFDFEALGLDFACGGSHKWLCSPVGVGFLVSRSEHIPKLAPLTIGASTYGTCDDPSDLSCSPKLNALRFESGSKQVLEITALGASAELIYRSGLDQIRTETERLGRLLAEGLLSGGCRTHATAGSSPAFVNFSHPKRSLDELSKRLAQSRVSFARRGPGLRLSPHAFNEDGDIQAALEALR